ncbi:hypothetical protein K501DRAFT_267213 [Backusella circina FSU 941]|nr:hypothetical protein K501DRAFT_267213 [Backusella circina FSU 941]
MSKQYINGTTKDILLLNIVKTDVISKAYVENMHQTVNRDSLFIEWNFTLAYFITNSLIIIYHAETLSPKLIYEFLSVPIVFINDFHTFMEIKIKSKFSNSRICMLGNEECIFIRKKAIYTVKRMKLVFKVALYQHFVFGIDIKDVIPN